MAAGTAWAAANAKLQWNYNPTTRLSLGSGYMGGEIAGIIDLGGGRSAACLGDVQIATAAGQRGFYTGSDTNPGAPLTDLVSGGILIFDNYDPSLMSNPQVWHKTNAEGQRTGFFPPITKFNTPSCRSTVNGQVIDGKLIIGGHLLRFKDDFPGFDINGFWHAIVDNIASTPDNWVVRELPHIASGTNTDRVDIGNLGLTDPGDGWVYMWGAGPGADWSVCRVPKSRAKYGHLDRAEWWSQEGWQRDRRGEDIRNNGGMARRRGGLFGFTLPEGEVDFGGTPIVLKGYPGFGKVHKRASDGRYQLTAGFTTPILSTIPPTISYGLTPGTEVAQFPSHTVVYNIPETDKTTYNMGCAPHLTWSGKGANDQVWTYNVNGPGDYWPRFVKATGLT